MTSFLNFMQQNSAILYINADQNSQYPFKECVMAAHVGILHQNYQDCLYYWSRADSDIHEGKLLIRLGCNNEQYAHYVHNPAPFKDGYTRSLPQFRYPACTSF